MQLTPLLHVVSIFFIVRTLNAATGRQLPFTEYLLSIKMHPAVSTRTDEHESHNIAPVMSSLVNLNQSNDDAIETTWNEALTGHFHTL